MLYVIVLQYRGSNFNDLEVFKVLLGGFDQTKVAVFPPKIRFAEDLVMTLTETEFRAAIWMLDRRD